MEWQQSIRDIATPNTPATPGLRNRRIRTRFGTGSPVRQLSLILYPGVPLKERVQTYLDHPLSNFIMAILAIWVLFADDLRRALTKASADIYFDWSFRACLAIFIIEILLSWWAKPNYQFKFFFYLDLFSTLSVLLDVRLIMDFIYDAHDSYSEDIDGNDLTSIRAERIIRMLRLIRLIRLVKVYKQMTERTRLVKIEKELQSAKIKRDARDKKTKNSRKEDDVDVLNISRASISKRNADEVESPSGPLLPSSRFGNSKSKKRNELLALDPPEIVVNKDFEVKLEDVAAVRPKQDEEKKIDMPSSPRKRRSNRMHSQGGTQVITPFEETQQPEQPLSRQIIKRNLAMQEVRNLGLSVLNTGEQPASTIQTDRFLVPPLQAEPLARNSFMMRRDSKRRSRPEQLKDPEEFSGRRRESRIRTLVNANGANASAPMSRWKRGMSEHKITVERSEEFEKQEILEDLEMYEEELLAREERAMEDTIEETKIGRQVTFNITKILFSLMLLVVLSVPLFTDDSYVLPYTSHNASIQILTLLLPDYDSDQFRLAWNNTITAYSATNTKLISLTLYREAAILGDHRAVLKRYYMPNTNIDMSYFRLEEIMIYSSKNEGYGIIGYFDNSKTTKLNGILGIFRTLLVCLALSISTYFLSRDAEKLVINPIEGMISKVDRISENPLEAAAVEEKRIYEREELKQSAIQNTNKAKDELYEPSVLKMVIVKIGALLAIGFGEAGSEIISSSMSKFGVIDPTLPGKKILGVFGFCDISGFNDITEILKKDVMEFVNDIAQIVHSIVDFYFGAPNKNIGNAFLLVWKLPESEYRMVENDGLYPRGGYKTKMYMDLAVLAFIKIIGKISRSKVLSKYRENRLLADKSGEPFRVRMGFGLHVGWAIEGAIGSRYKIEASYLSPNVNLASRLEAATKQYGVPLLISGNVRNNCSTFYQQIMRRLDRVKVKGSNSEIDLYTVDLEYEKLEIDFKEVEYNKMTPSEKKHDKVKEREKKEDMMVELLSRTFTTQQLFEQDYNIKYMRINYRPDFYQKWNEGVETYLSTIGDWKQAKEIFEETLEAIPGRIDGPSKTLLNFMASHRFKRPPNWEGFRELTQK
jgi:class 3 adenylate cyclase